MKLLGLDNTVTLHLERDEAIALVNILDPDNSEMLRKMARDKHGAMFAEMVRQIDLWLNFGE
jgi:hypothetical protein